jgi:membrane protein required for colicin V production
LSTVVGGWNGLDWVLVAMLALSVVRAWMRGLVHALFGLLGFVGGFQLASWNYESIGGWLYEKHWLRSLPTARIIAFLVIAGMVVIVFEMVGRGVKKSAHAVGFGMLDRTFGAIFGFARGLLLGVAVIVGVTAFAPQSGWIESSKLSSYFLGAAHAVSFVVPNGLRQQVFNGVDRPLKKAGWMKAD